MLLLVGPVLRPLALFKPLCWPQRALQHIDDRLRFQIDGFSVYSLLISLSTVALRCRAWPINSVCCKVYYFLPFLLPPRLRFVFVFFCFNWCYLVLFGSFTSIGFRLLLLSAHRLTMCFFELEADWDHILWKIALDSRLCCLVVFSLMTSLFFGDRYLSNFKSGLWVWKK